jgi:AcrR family transcriptional regulator
MVPLVKATIFLRRKAHPFLNKDRANPVLNKSSRPKRADAERNRRRIIEAAQALFSERGRSVEIDEIAHHAGVGVGSVYRHFSTKEALFEAMVTGHVEHLIQDAWAFTKAADHGKAFFEFLSLLVTKGLAKKHLMEVLAKSGIRIDCISDQLREEFREVMDVLLTRAQRSGTVRSDIGVTELLALIRGVFVALEGCTSKNQLNPAIFKVVCDGLRPNRLTNN